MWPFRKTAPTPEPKPERKQQPRLLPLQPKDYPAVDLVAPVAAGVAMDSKFQRFGLGQDEGVPQAVGEWYASQRFVGHQQAAWMAKHWLVDKAINMPARDALRQGWELDGEPKQVQALTAQDKRVKINARMHELVTNARRTGGAVAVMLTCPAGEDEAEYYAAPLNIEAVTEYHGIAVIDAADAQCEPLAGDLNNPASLMHMTASFYRIGTRRYHHSHCVAVTPYPVADQFKPTYRYWGASLPERIYERVYAAERCASEAPLLMMTKRLRALGIDLQALMTDDDAMTVLQHNVAGLQQMADNLGVFVYDSANNGGLTQLETALADVDSVIMTQYQLVAAIAEIPVTKLLGTTPKGFNATGESEAEDYRQSLESIQSHDMQPLLEKHYRIVAQVAGIEPVPVTWLPLDSPTADEFAEIDSKNAAAVSGLVNAMVITPAQGAVILSQQKESMFHGIDAQQANELDAEAEGLLDGVFAELNNENDTEA